MQKLLYPNVKSFTDNWSDFHFNNSESTDCATGTSNIQVNDAVESLLLDPRFTKSLPYPNLFHAPKLCCFHSNYFQSDFAFIYLNSLII